MLKFNTVISGEAAASPAVVIPAMTVSMSLVVGGRQSSHLRSIEIRMLAIVATDHLKTYICSLIDSRGADAKHFD